MLLTESTLPVAPAKPGSICPLTDVQLSHLRTKTGGSAAANCHAVRYRLSNADSKVIQKNFDDGIARWEARLDIGASRRPKLWIEPVPASSDSLVGVRWRTAEIMRTIEATELLLCRAVLVQYQDGVSDLILVAHRAVLDRPSLQFIAHTILTGVKALPGQPIPLPFTAVNCTLPDHPRLEELCKATYGSCADWGFGTGKSELGESRLSLRVDFAQGLDSTSFNAAVGLALARYSGLQTSVVATLITHPDRPAGTLGPYEGITLIPIQCLHTSSTSEILCSTAQRISNPLPWYTPELVGTLAACCENEGKVLVGTFFIPPEHATAGLMSPVEYVPCLAPPFPLTIICAAEIDGSSVLTCIFQSKDFSASVVGQFMDAIVRVHRQLHENPELELREIHISDSEDSRQVALLGQSHRTLPAQEERIEQAFARTASQTPHAPALTYGEQHLTYQELDGRANRMAHALRRHGIEAGDLIGICLERSLELVTVLLAILKAGAAYVPLDPSYPIDRLAYMINDAKLSLVIVSGNEFPAGKDIQILHPEELLQHEFKHTAVPQAHATNDDAAYVIYTSGSTGRPKGVVIPHRNVVNLLAATTDDFGLSSADTWTLFHSSAFDFSVWEIWGCLLTGGHLIVVPYWVSRSAEEFCDLLAKEHVTVLNQTPSAFAQLLEIDRDRPLASTLRLVIFGGERLDTSMLLQWFDRHPESRCRMVNMFGITETTVHVTLETITRKEALAGSRSVGRALPGWYFYVMDAQCRMLPPGVTGEIYVGGAGVAAFYLNRPELTAERFVPDPYTGARMYRSGDKGRLRPDGRLEHLGRLDTQVKIRGFRVELDEIRSVLLEAPGVVTAAVLMHCDDPEDAASAYLCAYVVMRSHTLAEIRCHLDRVLPDYMVPSLIDLPALPLTINGKLDIARLPLPVRHPQIDLHSMAKTADADDGLTAVLLNIWQKVLGVPVGLDDNFFDLGGNSLYAMRVATMMRKQGLTPLPVRQLYSQQTIRRLVALSIE
jgi:amino acid adenylation domain-containing protein